MTKYWLVAPLAVSLFGCGGDTTGPVSHATAATAYWALRLNQHAITLSVAAPHNTIQLHATPLTEASAALPTPEAVTYTILGGDTSVAVSASGVVTARVPSYQSLISVYHFPVASVMASLTIGGTTLADTALVQVTATAPVVPLRRISIQPPAESLALYQSGHWLLQGNTQPLPLAQLDVNGDTVSNGLIYVRSSDPTIGFGYGGGCEVPGQCVRGVKAQADVTFYVQLWYYGVDASDSLRVRVGYSNLDALDAYQTAPLNSRDVQLYWWPTTVDVTAPAEVFFQNDSPTIPIDAIFDHPEDVHIDTGYMDVFGNGRIILPTSAEGNVAPLYSDTVGAGAACAQAHFNGTTHAADSTCLLKNSLAGKQSRTFTTPGTYAYHTRFGNGGKIVVH